MSSLSLQLRVVAFDNGTPRKENATIIPIIVDRNVFAPEFTPETVLISIVISETNGSAITRVSATDRDEEVSID